MSDKGYVRTFSLIVEEETESCVFTDVVGIYVIDKNYSEDTYPYKIIINRASCKNYVLSYKDIPSRDAQYEVYKQQLINQF